METMIGQTISHYKILEKLGEGGMGVVYKAQDTKLDRYVALKFLPSPVTTNSEETTRFLHEAHALSSLNHPHIATIHDVEDAGEQKFIVLEYLEGGTLKQKVKHKQLPLREILDYAIQIAEGLAYAHMKEIVHRDIKTDNIMISSEGQLKITDFGLAKLRGATKLTKTGSAVGTAAYMSPEQALGEVIDQRSDIFSFGLVLYELITGELPFRGEHEAALMYEIVHTAAKPLKGLRSDVPDELQWVVDKALAKDASDRYQRVDDMLVDLKRLKKGSETQEILRRAGGRADVRKRKYPKLVLTVTAIAILAVIISVIMLIPKRSRELNPNVGFRVLQTPFTQIGSPGISKDGNWVAFPAADANGTWDIYLIHASGGEPRRVTHDSSSSIASADISPDGSQITYDRGNGEVCAISVLGGFSKKVAAGSYAHWRPDGKRIGYVKVLVPQVQWKSGKRGFFSVNPDGSDDRLEFSDDLVSWLRSSFSWSPDGKSVAWLRTFAAANTELIVRDLGTGTERQLTFDKKTVGAVSWTSRGEIIFSSDKGGNTELWMIPAAGGEAIRITIGSGSSMGVTISSNGQRLVYFQREQIDHIWIARLPDWQANIDGTNAHQISFDDRRIRSISFSPDKKYVAFQMADPDLLKAESHIYVMERDGSNRRQLTTGDEAAGMPRWSPDGKWIAYYSYAVSEPSDSARIYLIEASNPGNPKLIGRGTFVWWLDSINFVVVHGNGSYQTSIDGEMPKQFYEDSTFAVPILKRKYIVFYDLREGRRGHWLLSVTGSKGPQSNTPEKILPVESGIVRPILDGKVLLYEPGDGIWQVSLPDGKTGRLSKLFSGVQSSLNIDVSDDAKEAVYVDSRFAAKLVMIENLFNK